MRYATEEAAFARVNQLREVGIWPGIRRSCACGIPRCEQDGHLRWWTVLYDPPLRRSQMTAHGYLKGPGFLW